MGDSQPGDPAKAHSATWRPQFRLISRLPLTAAFDAGRLTSDGGLVWLGEADQSLGVCEALAACIPDWRRGAVLHSLPTLVRQRIFQIACGYADQNDATTLRSDPLLKAVCGRLPESGADLASQPTLSRLENAVDRHACEAMAEALVALYIRERQRSGAPSHLVLDIDGTDDPIHGNQEGGAYHGFYREHIYHPVLVFDGQTDQLITAVLRPGRCHESRFVVLILRRLLKRLRAAWPQVTIELRADSGFAVPRLYAWCEANGLTYTIGMIPNRRLVVFAAPLLSQALAQSQAQGGSKVRLVGETAYQARTWIHPRRVIYKAEALSKGPNTRFVVTSRSEDPMLVYDWYVDRGEPENWLKDLKNAVEADRLSDHRFWANAFRLLMHAAAYWLLDTLRRWLIQVIGDAARVQLDTLRLRLVKIGARLRELPSAVRLHLASSHPGQPLWDALVAYREAS
ncbi:MAG: IS1380 family transposase [Chloroflexota bacterium]|nr:IS1380 family transposase [Chloroflexota bacterium]